MKHPYMFLMNGALAVALMGAASPAGCGGNGSTGSAAQASGSGKSSSGGEGKRDFRARLTGFQETPAIVTPGHGTFRAMLGEDGTTVTFELTYADLKGVGEGGAPTLAHVHVGQRGVAGAVSVFLCGGGGRAACPAQPATVTGTFTASDVVGPAAQGVAAGGLADLFRAARAGVTYVNVHSAGFTSGEIRGQLRAHRDEDEDRDDDD